MLLPLVSLSISTTFDSDDGLNALVEDQDVFTTIRLGLDGFDVVSGLPTLAPLPAPPGGLRVYIDSDVPNILDRFDLSSFTSDPQFLNIDVTSFTPNSDNSGFAVTVNEGETVGAFNLRLLDNVEPDPNSPEILDGLVNATFTLRTQQEVPSEEEQITGISTYIPDPFATVNTLFLADDASQLPSVPPSEPLDPPPTIEVGISVSTDFEDDVAILVEDQATTAVVRFDLSEPAPLGGLRVYFETGTSQVLDRLNLFDILLNPRLENIDVSTFVTDFDDSGAALTIDEGATFGIFQVDIGDNVESDTVPFSVLDGLSAIALTLKTPNDISPENETFIVGVSEYGIDPDSAFDPVFFADTKSQVLGQQGEDFFIGTRRADRFTGTSVDEQIYGLSGNDVLLGGFGDDVIFGGNGNDKLRGDIDNVLKPSGDDIIHGGNGKDRILGHGGNDQLFGDAGNDVILGEEGDDLLRGGLGNDRLRGDKSASDIGQDTFVLAVGEGTDIIHDFAIGEDFIGLAEGLSFGALSITQRGRRRTLIEVGDETLAILRKVNAKALIASADTTFTVV